MKTLISFDIDGTILSGIPSFYSLSKYFFQKNKTLYLESKPIPPIARKVDKFDDYVAFPTIFFRKPRKNIASTLNKLSKKPNLDLAILSGRGKKTLQNITIKELKKHQLFKYFNNQIFLKPLTYKSSTTWKLHCLENFAENYQKVYHIDNDLISSLQIAKTAQEKKLPIQIFVIKSLETNKTLLKLLNLEKKIKSLPNLKIINFSQISKLFLR